MIIAITTATMGTAMHSIGPNNTNTIIYKEKESNFSHDIDKITQVTEQLTASFPGYTCGLRKQYRAVLLPPPSKAPLTKSD